jgi:type VI secretion system secreted protein VgrG
MSESIGPVTVTSSVADFEFRSLLGTEELGQPFRYEVEVLNRSSTLSADKMLGSTMTITLTRRDGKPRYFNGYVTDFSLSGIMGEFVVYSVTLRPWLLLLSPRTRCRIYKGTALEIVKQVADADEYIGHSVMEEGLLDTKDLQTYEFVVQFRESDLDFFMRVLERDGIYFYFEHSQDHHKLVLTNDGGYEVAEYKTILYRPPSGHSTAVQESIDDWRSHHSLTAGKLTSREFSYKAPNTDLLAKANVPPAQAIKHLEVYDYPAAYFEPGQGEPLARRRLETLQVRGVRYEGTTNVRTVGAGMVFSLSEHPFKAFNVEYLIYAAQFQIASHAPTSGPAISIGGDVMRSSVIALEKKRPFYPTLRTPKPAMPSIQSAIVVGEPTGDEIYLDDKDYCRVKVRFHWDPDADTTGKNSCWVRVSQTWAGSGFGAQFHPRLGQEVLVGFLEGDPDRPIIVGRVYNDENRPPYTSPTQSGIKTDSTIDKDLANYNEIRFEDKAGSEELFVQAQKTHTVNVKGSQSISVAGSRSLSVGGNDSTTVGKNRKVTVTGSETIEVTDFRKITVHQYVEENYFKKHTILVGEAQAMQAKTQEFNAEGGIQIIQSPETKQTLKDGVVNVLGATKVELKVGESSIVIEGTTITITSAGVVSVKGTQVKINS